MRIKTLLILIYVCCAKFLHGQNSDYKANAENLQNTIWQNPKDGFELKAIPENLKNESAVILSRSYEVELSSTKKFKFMVITATVLTQTNKLSTLHERTLIKDKAALEAYSTINYQKALNESEALFFGASMNNIINTYVGVKIIKPDNKEIIVNTGEEVLLKNTESDKKGKLAIPNLQVGDIIDYYICTMESNELFNENYQEVEILNNEYYTLNYNYKYTFSDKFFVKHTVGNNCPAFNISTDKEGNTIYNLSGKNLPKKTSAWWTSPFRTYPYFEMKPSMSARKEKKIYEKEIDNVSKIAQSAISRYKESGNYYKNVFDFHLKTAKSFYKKKKENVPLDSLLEKMYDSYRFNFFCSYAEIGKTVKQYSMDKVRSDLNEAFGLSELLKDNDIDNEVIIATSRYWKKIEEANGDNDVSYIVKIYTDKPSYVYFNRVHNTYNELPSYLQGETGYSIYQYTNKKKYETDIKPIIIPASPQKDNVVNEELSVDVLPGMQKIKINRKVQETGAMKLNDQYKLLDMRLIHSEMQKSMNSKEDLTKALNGLYKLYKERHYACFDQDLVIQDEYYTELIKSQYELTPEQVSDKAILKTGLVNPDKSLVFFSSFVLPSFIQKAGSNYLINVGKLIGTIAPVKTEDRTRTVDVYMPSARELNYKINLNIPKGYKVKGIDQLGKSVSNDCGSFTSTASISGNVLTLLVSRTYAHNFEKAAQWPKLVNLLDTAFDFTNQKVLLEKL